MTSQKKRVFKPGDSAGKVLDAEWLNSLEERLTKLENLVVAAPLELQQTSAGYALTVAGTFLQLEFVQLKEQLNDDGEADVNVLRYSTDSGDYEDVGFVINAKELCHKTSLDDARGILIRHPRSTVKRWVFIPWPLAQGDDLPGYDFTKTQVLAHNANDWLRWIDVVACP